MSLNESNTYAYHPWTRIGPPYVTEPKAMPFQLDEPTCAAQPSDPEVRLVERLAYWLQRMGLSEWQVEIYFEDSEGECPAQIEYDVYHYQAHIAMKPGHPEDQWDHTIVHELLHLMFGCVETFISDALSHLDKGERQVLESLVEGVIEPVINRVTRAVVGSPRPLLELRKKS